MPSRPTHTPLRNVRVPEDLWKAALARAQQEGTTVTAVVLDALRAYVGKASS